MKRRDLFAGIAALFVATTVARAALAWKETAVDLVVGSPRCEFFTRIEGLDQFGKHLVALFTTKYRADELEPLMRGPHFSVVTKIEISPLAIQGRRADMIIMDDVE